MTFSELFEKVNKASIELRYDGLAVRGYGIRIELSIESYRDLLNERDGRIGVRLEADNPKECVHRGTIFGVPFVLTKETDRVFIAKEV